jgi:cytochrome c oxidase cbb3-type subunit 2
VSPASTGARRVRLARAVFAVAATYFAFLIHAQFGFLDRLRSELGDPARVRLAMAAMGLAGLVASAGTAVALRRGRPESFVRWGLLAIAAVAPASLGAHGAAALTAVAAATGGALAMTTVALAGGLESLAGGGSVAWAAGLGTGIAYALANLPPLYFGSVAVRAWSPAALAIGAAFAVPRTDVSSAVSGSRSEGLERRGFAAAVGALALLVFIDSALFSLVHRDAALAAGSWGRSEGVLLQGLAHLAGAIAAALLVARRRWATTIGATWICFAAGYFLLARGGSWAGAGGRLYALGIALYSTALVALPALSAPGDARRAAVRAAGLYGVAGWIGSALGVGMAEDLGRLPPLALPAVGAGLALAGLAAAGRRALAPLAPFAGAARLAALAGIGLGLLGLLRGIGGIGAGERAADLPSPAASAERAAIARGRAVYVAEGCIHCHSQFVRPGADEIAWGPARGIDRAERPPLVGNRRLGPDLANVGLRRTPFWNELHLTDPRALSPGSRMPSYARLFAGDGGRGRDLVAYLAALGAAEEAPRAATVAAWRPDLGDASPSVARGARLFATLCSPCHGAGGRGDGPLAPRIARATLDLGSGPFVRAPRGVGDPEFERWLPRAIKFGLPPAPMPGHETLADLEIADLAAFVRTLAAASGRAAEGRP